MLLKIFSLTSFSLFLTSCATGYHPRNLAGGYEEQEIGTDRWMVSFHGNGHTSGATVKAYALRRVLEICEEEGFDDYKILDRDKSV